MSEADRVAAAVRRVCIEAAVRAWEDAGIQGLCGEGRFEVAVGAMRTLDLGAIVKMARSGTAGGS